MNVCMISHSFYESDCRVLQYANALVGRGDSVDVLSLRSEGMPKFEILQGVRVFRIMKRKVNEHRPLQYLIRILRFLVIASLAVSRRHLWRHYDVVHVHSVPDFLVFAALVPKLFGARIVLDIHDILPEFYASKFRLPNDSKLFRLLLLCERVSTAFADGVIVANELWRNRLISRSVPAGKCIAIRNYPDPHVFFPHTEHKDPCKFRIIYPGTLNWHQGVDVALRAFAQVAVQIPEAVFDIYGQGPEKTALLGLRDQLGLTERVHIEGLVPVKQIACIMARADVAVVPKRASSAFGNEAASTKIMEFMALGVPVIVSRTRIDNFYHDDSMVKFVDPENASSLAAAIIELRNDAGLRRSLVEHALRYVKENRWEKKKEEYFQIIDPPPVGFAATTKGPAHA